MMEEKILEVVEDIPVERTQKGAYLTAVNVPNGVPGSNHGQSAVSGGEANAKDERFLRELREEMTENRRLEDEADSTGTPNHAGYVWPSTRMVRSTSPRGVHNVITAECHGVIAPPNRTGFNAGFALGTNGSMVTSSK